MTYLLVSVGAIVFVNVILPVLNGLAETLLARLGKWSAKDQVEAAMYAKDLEAYGADGEQNSSAIGFQFSPKSTYEDEEDE